MNASSPASDAGWVCASAHQARNRQREVDAAMDRTGRAPSLCTGPPMGSMAWDGTRIGAVVPAPETPLYGARGAHGLSRFVGPALA